MPAADLVAAYVQEDPLTYRGAPGFSKKVVMAMLARLDGSILREILVESWACRATATLRNAHRDLR